MVLSGALAVPLAAGLQAVGTWRAVFVASAIQGVWAAIAIRGRVPRDARPSPGSMTTGRRPGRVLRRPQIIAIAALTATNIALYAFLVGVSLNLGHASPSTDGSAAFLFAFFVGSLFGAPLGGRASDRLGRWRVATVSLGAFAVGAVPLAVTGGPWLVMAILGSLVGGGGAGAAGGALQASTVDGIPASHAGRVSGLASTARYLGAAIGSTLASVGTGHTVLGVCVGLAFVPIAAAVAAAVARSVRPMRRWEHATATRPVAAARSV